MKVKIICNNDLKTEFVIETTECFLTWKNKDYENYDGVRNIEEYFTERITEKKDNG